MHQLVEEEAQIIAFLIEHESGLEATAQVNAVTPPLDDMMDKAVENQLFMKYLKYARLQATKHALKYTEDYMLEARNQDQNMLNYASWTKERHNELESQLISLRTLMEKHT